MNIKRFIRIAAMAAAIFHAHASLAGNWVPVGVADALDSLVATHPSIAGQVTIQAGYVYRKNGAFTGQETTYFTSNAGATWEPHARPGQGGKPWMAGVPTIVYLSESGSVQRSNDLGRSFFPLTPPPSGGNFSGLAGVNPANADELVYWTGAVISRSIDGGMTWITDPPAPGAISLLVVDWQTRRLYATFSVDQPVGNRPIDAPNSWGVGGQTPAQFLLAAGNGVVLYQNPTGSLFRSINGGTTFDQVAQALGPLELCTFGFGAPASMRIYALECVSGRVLRSDNDGATWAITSTIPPEYNPKASLAVDAGDANRVYIGTSKGVVSSGNGGGTFALLPRGTNAPGSGRNLIFDGIDSMRQWLADDSPGFFRSVDGGSQWSFVGSDWHPIASSRNRTATLFGARLEDHEFGVSTDGGSSWTTKINAAGRFSILGPITYGQAAGELFLYGTSGSTGGGFVSKLYYSNDDGETWSERFPPPVGVNVLAATQSGTPILYAAGSPMQQGGPQLYRSLNGGVTWQAIATFPAHLSSFGGTAGNNISAFAIDPANPQRLYAGFEFPNYVMRSEDGGTTWTRIQSGLGAGKISAFAFDPVNSAIVYASQFGSGVFRSTDRGASWTALDAGLGDELVLAVGHDPFTADRLFASTGSGVYRAQLSSGLPASWRRAIEFYHAQFNHYFVSADNDEVAGLDDGVFQGWSRTGEAFRVTEATTPGSAPVCRFFSVGFAPLSTHFYTPYPQECESLKTNPAWVYERIAFGLMLPDPPPSRGCRAGTRALYRLWNRNLDGAPNHRYTTSPFTFGNMEAQGWLYEGEYPTRVFACVPYA